MTDIVIKPSNSEGSVKLQTEGGTNGLTMASTGVLTTSGNVAVTGTVTGGTLGSGVTFPTGHIIQVKNHKTTTRGSASVTGASPAYNTGASYTTFTFTPHKSTSKLLLTSTSVNVNQISNVGDNVWLCAAYDTTLIGSVLSYMSFVHWDGNLDATFVSFNHQFNSWGTTEKTIDIRFGSNATETVRCNDSSNSTYDNIADSFHEQCFTVMEIAQ